MATFTHKGDSIDYTPGSAVTGGDVVVQNDLVAVAKLDIAADVKGALAVKGVFAFPKTAGTSEAIAVGEKCYWDATYSVATTTAGANKLIGKCTKAAADDDETVEVRLNQ